MSHDDSILDSLTMQDVVKQGITGGMGSTPPSPVMDENFDNGVSPPIIESDDLAVPRTDSDELTVRTAWEERYNFEMSAANTKHGPNWCFHCQVNHHKTTTCPYKGKSESEVVSTEKTNPVPPTVTPPATGGPKTIEDAKKVLESELAGKGPQSYATFVYDDLKSKYPDLGTLEISKAFMALVEDGKVKQTYGPGGISYEWVAQNSAVENSKNNLIIDKLIELGKGVGVNIPKTTAKSVVDKCNEWVDWWSSDNGDFTSSDYEKFLKHFPQGIEQGLAEEWLTQAVEQGLLSKKPFGKYFVYSPIPQTHSTPFSTSGQPNPGEEMSKVTEEVAQTAPTYTPDEIGKWGSDLHEVFQLAKNNGTLPIGLDQIQNLLPDIPVDFLSKWIEKAKIDGLVFEKDNKYTTGGEEQVPVLIQTPPDVPPAVEETILQAKVEPLWNASDAALEFFYKGLNVPKNGNAGKAIKILWEQVEHGITLGELVNQSKVYSWVVDSWKELGWIIPVDSNNPEGNWKFNPLMLSLGDFVTPPQQQQLNLETYTEEIETYTEEIETSYNLLDYLKGSIKEKVSPKEVPFSSAFTNAGITALKSKLSPNSNAFKVAKWLISTPQGEPVTAAQLTYASLGKKQNKMEWGAKSDINTALNVLVTKGLVQKLPGVSGNPDRFFVGSFVTVPGQKASPTFEDPNPQAIAGGFLVPVLSNYDGVALMKSFNLKSTQVAKVLFDQTLKSGGAVSLDELGEAWLATGYQPPQYPTLASHLAELLSPLVDTGVVTRFTPHYSPTEAPDVVYLFGGYMGVAEAPKIQPMQGKNPTGICSKGHKTYCTPTPTYCPSCGTPMQKMESFSPENFNPSDLFAVFHANPSFEPGSDEVQILKALGKFQHEGATEEELHFALVDKMGDNAPDPTNVNALLGQMQGQGFVQQNPTTGSWVFGQFGNAPPEPPPRGKVPSVEEISAKMGWSQQDIGQGKALASIAKKPGIKLPELMKIVGPGYTSAAIGGGLGKAVVAGHLELSPSGGYKIKTLKYTKPDSAEVCKALGWNVGGKGEAFLRAVGKAEEVGMTIDEAIEKMPKPLAGSKKPDAILASSLMNQAIAKGYATALPGTSPQKYVFGYFGDKPVPTLPKPSSKPEPVIKEPPAPPMEVLVSGGNHEKWKLPPKPAPIGTSVAVYDMAFSMGVDLHDPDHAKAWETSIPGKIAEKLRNGGAYTALVLSPDDATPLRYLVNQGMLKCDYPEKLFGNHEWKMAQLTLGSLPKGAEVNPDLPPASRETWSTDEYGVAKRTVLVDPIVSDSLKAWGSDAVYKVLAFMSTDPGRQWSKQELARHGVDVDKLTVNDKLFIKHADARYVNWPLVMSASATSSGSKCPKCEVVHKSGMICPQTPIKKTGVIPVPVPTKWVKSPVSIPSAHAGTAASQMSFHEATKKMKVNQGTLGHVVLSMLKNEQNLATINVALSKTGFKQTAASFLQKGVEAGVLQKTPAGGYVISGGGVGVPELPVVGKTDLHPDVEAQPAPGLEEIRIQYRHDHPIQKMAVHHAQRFHELQGWYDQALDPANNAKLAGKSRANLKLNDFLTQGSDLMGEFVSTFSYAIGRWWKGTPGSPGGQILMDSIEQMSMNSAPVNPKRPTMKGSHSVGNTVEQALKQHGVPSSDYFESTNSEANNCTFVVHKKDPDAPSFLGVPTTGWGNPQEVATHFGVPLSSVTQYSTKFWIKGPSRSEIMLQQFAMTQSALKRMGVTSIDMFRGFQDGGYVDGVSEMVKEEADNKAKGVGTGAKVYLNPASSWSTNLATAKSFSGSSGVQLSKNVPTHFVFMHQDQDVKTKSGGSGHVFGQYTNSEWECVLFGHASTTISPAKKGAIVKISQLETHPESTSNIPDGFGIWEALPDGRVFWITNESSILCVFPDLDDFKLRRSLDISMVEAAPAA
jgi:hypothetical protein